jgi:hypothetical protein
MHDVFQVQDDIVQRVVSALALPLTAREHRLLRHDVPANPTAYEFYLRGSQLIQQVGLESLEPMRIARDLFRRSVEEDPLYAPAWARLGRCYRVIGKAGEDVDENLARAETSLERPGTQSRPVGAHCARSSGNDLGLGRCIAAVDRARRCDWIGSPGLRRLVQACRAVYSRRRSRRMSAPVRSIRRLRQA